MALIGLSELNLDFIPGGANRISEKEVQPPARGLYPLLIVKN